MPLSRYEQRVLDEIATGVRTDDPAFAKRLNLETAGQYLRRSTVFAHGYLWLGIILTLTGFGLVHDVLGTGVLLILYGAGIMIAGLVRILQLRPIDGVQRFQRSDGGSGASSLE